MSHPKAVILYHAYGVAYSYQQALFSILTLYHHLGGDFGGITVVVYTDKPELFRAYAGAMPLTTEPLTTSILADFRGPFDFVHRVKICVIADCFQKYQQDILYLDGDTYFAHNPRPLLQDIMEGICIMNENCYDLVSAGKFEDMDWLTIRRVVQDHSYLLDSEEVNIPLTTRMWNAGIIGMNQRYASLLKNVLGLSDQIYAKQPVFTAEQFAFSYVLQNAAPMKDSGDMIFHYWPRQLKRLYNYHFQKFFQQNGKKPVAAQAEQAYLLTLRHDSLKLPERTVLDRILHRLDLIGQVIRKGSLKDDW